MTNLGPWLESLEFDRGERQLCRGYQVWVSVDGEVLVDAAAGCDGIGRPLAPTDLSALYCAGKPMTALAVGLLVDRGALRFDQPLRDLVSEVNPSLGGVTVGELLSHRAGLHTLRAELMSVVPLREHQRIILGTEVPELRPAVATYTVYSAWFLLGLVVERASGRGVRDFVTEEVIDAMGLGDDLFLGFDDDAWRLHAERLVVNVDLRERPPVPFLYETVERVCREVRPAIGTYGTARGLGRLYERLGAALGGEGEDVPVSTATLRSMVEPATERGWDEELERECRYGLGFMVELTDHCFGAKISPTAFGHSGYESTKFGFWDPSRRLACAVHYVGVVEDDRNVYRREAVLDRLLDAIDTRTMSTGREHPRCAS